MTDALELPFDPTHPFTCRCVDCRRRFAPYLSRDVTAEEIERHIGLVRQREILSGVRKP